MNRNSNILIIDGTAVFVRNWIQNPSMNDNGEPVGGIVGFLHTLYEMIDTFEPTRIIVAFDGKAPLDWRRSIYPDYKKDRFADLKFNRQYTILTNDDELKYLKNQFVTLYSILTNLPVTILSVERFESFDTIYHFIKNNLTDESKCTIISNNVDYLQLLKTNITLYSPYKKIKYDFNTGDEISPIMMYYFNVIHGKKNYNIPGVKNVGIKKFTKLFDCTQTNLTIDDLFSVCELNQKSSTVYRNILLNRELIDKNILMMSANHIYGDDVIEILVNAYNGTDTKFNKIKLLETLNHYKMMHSIKDFDFILDYTFSKLILK